jgi:hypothetical protein
VAIGVFILVVDSPIQATWLTEDEKILAVRRLESEYPAVNEAAQHTRKRTIRAGLLNINVSLVVLQVCLDVTGAQAWLVALAFFFISTPSLQGFSRGITNCAGPFKMSPSKGTRPSYLWSKHG